MMKTVEVKVSELEGAALDWAVAHAVKAWGTAHLLFPTMTIDPTFSGVEARPYPRGEYGSMLMTCVLVPNNPFRQDPQPFCPSTDWSQCGPFIDQYRPDMQTNGDGSIAAYLNNSLSDPEPLAIGRGETYLVAICRAIVAAKLGDTVQIPAELA